METIDGAKQSYIALPPCILPTNDHCNFERPASVPYDLSDVRCGVITAVAKSELVNLSSDTETGE